MSDLVRQCPLKGSDIVERVSRPQESVIVVVRPSLHDAWVAAGRPSLSTIVSRTGELGEPMARSTVHALLAASRGHLPRIYSGRIGIAKATTLARALDTHVSEVFEHANHDRISQLASV